MSNPESFINEVSEEVRRDRLYALMRRWGWVAILLILLLVGGAAFNEWRRAQAEDRAQVFGTALLDALEGEDMAARRAALAGIEPADAQQAAILTLLRATATLNGEGGDAASARAELLALADAEELSVTYRHLALVKAMLAGGTGDAAQDGAILEELAAPGAPYRPIAVELQALRALEAGDEATALTLLRILTEDAEATEALRRRALQLIVALGASPEPA
ncbi:hypothetical protein MWU52_06060 [Jannaschia sp. S6380]|uniref:hypothetical protein n=1 Tax=Jannaschia sp. S6380 TaxID=2926408 RepID=UPI001FF3A8D2|nr:hypothetical protein [Jannaschia sp. S6380]MCK0167109.1 hypothetical protein [Jannaschia sp. S6380]